MKVEIAHMDTVGPILIGFGQNIGYWMKEQTKDPSFFFKIQINTCIKIWAYLRYQLYL